MLGDKRPVIMEADRAIPGGVATLDKTGKLTEEQRPNYPIDDVPTSGSDNPVKSSGVFAVLQMKPNDQLLDNWYFAGGGSQQGGGQFPINQRGATTYNKSGYSIDRWKKTTGTSATLVVEKEGLTATGANAFILQLSEHVDYYNGKTLTWSILYKNKGLTTITSVFKKGTSRFSTSATGEAIAGVNASDDHEVCGLYALTGDYVVAAKLEIGSAQTLAHKDGDIWVLNDPPPNKALELAKCQRHQIEIMNNSINRANAIAGTGIVRDTKNKAIIFIPLPVTLRATPTIMYSGTWRIIKSQNNWGVAPEINGIDEIRYCRSGIYCQVQFDGEYESGTPVYLGSSMNHDHSLLIDCNL